MGSSRLALGCRELGFGRRASRWAVGSSFFAVAPRAGPSGARFGLSRLALGCPELILGRRALRRAVRSSVWGVAPRAGLSGARFESSRLAPGSPRVVLPWRFQIKIDGDKGVEDVGDPRGHGGTRVAVDGEGRGHRHEKDIRKAERQSDPDVQPHSALDFPRGERGADRGEDEGGHDGGEALVVLDLERLDIAHAPFLLALDVGMELGRGHRLAIVLGDEEVGGDDGERRVFPRARVDLLFHVLEIAHHVIDQRPVVERVVLDGLRREPRDEDFPLEMLEREAVSHVGTGVVAVEIGDDAGLDLQLGVADVIHLLVADVLVLEIDPHLVGGRDDEGVQDERDDGDDAGRDGVGQHEPPEAHPAREHGDDLRVVGQLGGEEDDGDEGEQGAEEVGEVGDEVHVIIHDDRLEGHVGVEELVDLLVDVEHDGDGDDQRDGEDVRPQELLDDVPIDPFQFEAHVREGL